jgi:very-short-patch-repair endonuclease
MFLNKKYYINVCKKKMNNDMMKYKMKTTMFSDTFNFNSSTIRMFGTADTPYFCAKDVGQILKFSNIRKALNDHVDVDYKIEYGLLVAEFGGDDILIKYHQKNLIYLDKNGLIQLLNGCKLPNKKDFIHWCFQKFGITYHIITRYTKEQETIGALLKVFSDENSKCQYVVENYRIDLYFIDKKLAIECDEFDHNDRDADYEKIREDTIRAMLNCEFIRYNPDSEDFCIFVLIGQIYKKLKDL